jgi:hypothetical protein
VGRVQVSEDYDTRPKPRYCHWQLLYVKDAVSLGTAEVSLDWRGPQVSAPAGNT